MKRDLKIPESISSRTEYKRKFSLREMYRAFVLIPSSLITLLGNKRRKVVDKDFIERLQLAVTEVNGCAACSYAHTYMALKQGMSSEEIHSLLSGDDAYVNQEEAKGILFAQHYADTRGFPKMNAYDSLLAEYGKQKSRVMMAAIQLMHAGDIYGIPYSALISRIKGKPYKDSTLFYELGMHLGGLIILPLALIESILRGIFGLKQIKS